MNTVFFDPKLTDQERRNQLYDGDIFVYSATKSSLELCHFAQELSRQAFSPHDPEMAQYDLPVEKYVEILAQLKPAFIHHPRCKELIQGIFRELGCDLEETYFDVPRLRTMAHGDYLKAGLAYAFHLHRDTWFSAPPAQVNWWLPVYDIGPDNTIAFHPKYWLQPVRNSSRDYNYYRWNKESRGAAASQIKTDTRKQPQAEEPLEMEPHTRVVCPSGGMILFSGQYMHSTVPNTSGRTRFSVDFRTANFGDVKAKRGARTIDSECTGTTLRDFLRGSDYERLREDVAAIYDSPGEQDGDLRYSPGPSASVSTM